MIVLILVFDILIFKLCFIFSLMFNIDKNLLIFDRLYKNLSLEYEYFKKVNSKLLIQ